MVRKKKLLLKPLPKSHLKLLLLLTPLLKLLPLLLTPLRLLLTLLPQSSKPLLKLLPLLRTNLSSIAKKPLFGAAFLLIARFLCVHHVKRPGGLRRPGLVVWEGEREGFSALPGPCASVEFGQQLLRDALARGTGGRLALFVQHAHDAVAAFALHLHHIAAQAAFAVVSGTEQA